MAEYIDRELVIKAVRNEDKDVMADYGEEYGTEWGFSEEKIIGVIMKVPAADVAPVVHGKWVYNKNATDWGIGGYVCSECQNKNNNLPCSRVKSVRMFSGAKYCPECGAKMDKEG